MFVGLFLLGSLALPLLAECMECCCCDQALLVSAVSSVQDGCCSGSLATDLTFLDSGCSMAIASPHWVGDLAPSGASYPHAPAYLQSAVSGPSQDPLAVGPYRYDGVLGRTQVGKYLLNQAFLL